MLVRTFPLAVASALILTACGDQSPPNAPLPRIIAPKANAAMNPVTVCGGVTTMPVGECETLVEIYNDLDGAWMDQIDWPTKADPCTWTRVVCADGDHGSVVELNMHQAGLWSPIPAAVADLPQLRVLRFGFNFLSGTIPAALGTMAHLEVLDLGFTGLSGTIPAALGNIATLQELDLHSSSNLTGPIPAALGNATNLRKLNLFNTPLGGSIPSELGNLTNLEYLNLAQVELTGAIPESLGNLTKLSRLILSENALTGSIPAPLGNLVSADTILLDWNQLSGSIPATIGNATSLRMLDLGVNNLTGSLPASLGNLVNLRRIDVHDNELSGSIPASLFNLPSLEVVSFSDNEFTGPIPTNVGSATSLRFLALTRNAFTGGIPESLAQLTNLETLWIAANDLSGLVPLGVATLIDAIDSCELISGNAGLYVPDSPAYRAVDVDADGKICNLAFSSAEDIGEDAIDDIDELVPDVLNEGQANALKTKIENAMEKAAKGQYGAAINQMQAFLTQLNDMVANGTLTPAQAAPFIQQAESLIAIWTGMLPS